MRLALATGRVNVDEMLEEMSSEQWLEWMAFSELEPFGPDQQLLEAGKICETIAAAHGMKSSDSGTLSARDFFGRTMLGIDRQKEAERLLEIEQLNNLLMQKALQAQRGDANGH
jgi:hypothetical protein